MKTLFEELNEECISKDEEISSELDPYAKAIAFLTVLSEKGLLSKDDVSRFYELNRKILDKLKRFSIAQGKLLGLKMGLADNRFEHNEILTEENAVELIVESIESSKALLDEMLDPKMREACTKIVEQAEKIKIKNE